MEIIRGRVDEDAAFLVRTDNGERPCILYVTEMQAGSEPERVDLSQFAAQPVVVTCQTFSGDVAWGVSDVSADLSG